MPPTVSSVLCSVGLQAALAAAAMCHTVRAESPRPQPVTVLAHNGYFKEENWPESSLQGFLRMLQLGIDGSEIDIWRLPDGNFVVYHDSETAFALRAGDGYGNLWQMDYPHLCAIDKSFYFLGQHPREPVLLLADVLAFARETGFILLYDPKFLKHPSAPDDLAALRRLTADERADALVFWKKDAVRILRETKADIQGVRPLPTGAYYADNDDWWRLYQDARRPETRQVSVYFPTVTLDALERGPRPIQFDLDAFRARCRSLAIQPIEPPAPHAEEDLLRDIESPDLQKAQPAFFHARRRQLKAAIPLCLRILDERAPDERFARPIDAARTLGALRAPDAAARLISVCRARIEGPGAATLRGASAWALAVTTAPPTQMLHAQALDALHAVLTYPEKNFYDAKFPKRVAADALSRQGDEGARRLADALASTSDQTRLYAAWALIGRGAKAMPPLRPLLTTAAPPLAAERAAWIAGWLRDAQSAPPLAALLESPDEKVRARAAWALGRLRHKPARPLLEKSAQTDPAAEVRAAAAQAIDRLEKSPAP